MSFYTQGNKIVNEKGEIIILKGVSRTGLEYAYVDLDAMIPETIAFDIQLMRQWGFNAIRFPLRDRFWLNDLQYKQKIQYWVGQTLQNNMYAILDLHTQQDHPGLDPFMYRLENGGLDMWIDIAKTYKDTPRVFFEIFNEPHGISPEIWWNGDSQYYGYKEVLEAVRKVAKNICLIGGLDYAYQFHFVAQNTTLLNEMRTIPDLALSVHPYGYKGSPVNNGDETMPIPTTIVDDPPNYSGDCHLGISVPTVPPSQYGWDESFGFMVKEQLFPVIATEWGLDRPDNCIQGGWYNTQILNYMNSLNMSYMAWAWVQDRLDYPSLLDGEFQPTGKGTKATVGPACSGPLNNNYPGPGVLVMNDLKQFQTRRLSYVPDKVLTSYIENVFVRNFFFLFVILFCVFHFMFFLFHIPEKKRQREPEFHRVVFTNKLQNSIRIRSSHSLPQLK
jgi:hypothetical protein